MSDAYDALVAHIRAKDERIAELEAEVERLRADAERYAWLRGVPDWTAYEKDGYGGQQLKSGEALDEAIDAARGK